MQITRKRLPQGQNELGAGVKQLQKHSFKDSYVPFFDWYRDTFPDRKFVN